MNNTMPFERKNKQEFKWMDFKEVLKLRRLFNIL